jgi:hypothetical protein
MVLASQESDVSKVTRSEGKTRCPGLAEDVGSLMPQGSQSLFKFNHSKHRHTVLNGFDNETIIKAYDVDSKKKNSIGKTCCCQPSIFLYSTSDGF